MRLGKGSSVWQRRTLVTWSRLFGAEGQLRGLGPGNQFFLKWLTVVICSLSLLSQPLLAQTRDDFEGGQPRWKLSDDDCEAKLKRQEISPQIPHSGLTCEAIEMRMGQGTLAVLGYGIPESLVLEEFRPSVWVRSTQRGIHFGVRVVFRRVLHPVTGKPRTLWIWGDSYASLGTWQRLQVENLPQTLAQKVRALRSEFGSELAWDDVVVDQVGLNVYSESGRSILQIDDLEIVGNIDATAMTPSSSLGKLASSASGDGLMSGNSLSSAEQQTTIVDSGSLQLPSLTTNRWLQYQGESLEWLSSLGMTGIVLTAPPTPQELAEVRRHGLKVICPPPAIPPPPQQKETWDIVEGWLMGSFVDRQSIDPLRRKVEEMRGAAGVLQKPFVIEPVESFWSYSRYSNSLIIPSPAAESYERAVELTDYLEGSLRECRGNPHALASIGTEPTIEWQRQIVLISSMVDQPSPSFAHGDPYQIRSQVYRALAAGVQGIYFRSRSPLDADSVVDRTRANMIQWLNAELELLNPWLGSGRGRRGLVNINDSNRDSTLWENARSQLIIVQPSGLSSHLSAATDSTAALKISLLQPSPAAQLIRITDWKLEPLPQKRLGGVVEIQIDRPHSIEFIISTSDPQVLTYFNQRFQSLGPNYAFAVANIAQMRMAAAQEIISARWQVAANNRFTDDLLMLQRSAREMEQAHLLVGENQPVANDLMLRTTETAQQVIHNAWQAARADVPSPQSAPWLLASSSIPLHWHLGRRISASSWNDLGLAGGSMDNLEVMMAAGWQQERRLEDQADVLTEVLPLDGESNQKALRIVSQGKGRALEGGYAGSTLRIRSGKMQVQAGQIVRIEARVFVRDGFAKPQAGLLFYESLEGPALGQLLKGPRGVWLPVRLYRAVQRSGPLEVMLEMRGEGDVLVDQITVAAAIPNAIQ